MKKTWDDFVAEANKRGVEVARSGERSHTLRGPFGHYLFENALPTDELCDIGDDTYNVTLAWKRVPSAIVKPVTLALAPSIMHNISLREVYPETIRAMTPSRVDEPCLLLMLPDGAQVLDGVHRLHVRAQMKLRDFKAYLLPGQTKPEILVHYWRIGPDGKLNAAKNPFAS